MLRLLATHGVSAPLEEARLLRTSLRCWTLVRSNQCAASSRAIDTPSTRCRGSTLICRHTRDHTSGCHCRVHVTLNPLWDGLACTRVFSSSMAFCYGDTGSSRTTASSLAGPFLVPYRGQPRSGSHLRPKHHRFLPHDAIHASGLASSAGGIHTLLRRLGHAPTRHGRTSVCACACPCSENTQHSRPVAS